MVSLMGLGKRQYCDIRRLSTLAQDLPCDGGTALSVSQRTANSEQRQAVSLYRVIGMESQILAFH